MESNSLSVIRSINLATLAPIVCKSLHREWFEIQSWKVSRLEDEPGSPLSLGLYRFDGTGHDRVNQGIPWSVLLKIVQSPANVDLETSGQTGDATHRNGQEHYSLSYSTGYLETLSTGMGAPCCFGVVQLPNDITLLWLEDVQDSSRVA